ncbi:hypothetical protein JOE58_000624 [Curtobacterium luteum]|uniref:BLUF domain-containing protein n=1 Tax=Curtobacterium luteum TaxID=33881 RepID=A0A8H9KZQ2_9MICO|nr:BLUF domain-containing protein [Curtobacterium luteum]MBM7801373.1 hypothetical protein [Curtobacterium luteum]GGK91000.1 hypothetical protein GCM10009769_06330 [Curtobacterium luteum]
MSNDPVPSTTDGPLLSLVYASRAVVGFDLDDLDELLAHARTANESAGITGLLLFKDHRFLQLLEGPEAAVRDKMTYITEDPRHDDVTVLLEEQVPERQFPGWTMGYATEDTLQHADLPGYRTTFDDIDFLPDDHEAGPVVPALRELIRWFRVTRPGGTARATAVPSRA